MGFPYYSFTFGCSVTWRPLKAMNNLVLSPSLELWPGSAHLVPAARIGCRAGYSHSFPAEPHCWDLHSTRPIVVTANETPAARRPNSVHHKHYKAQHSLHVQIWESHSNPWLFQSCHTCNVIKLLLATLSRIKPGLYCLHLLGLSYSSSNLHSFSYM